MATLQDFLQSMSNSAASNVSAPVDGINWLLRKAGLPVSEAPVMGSDWLAQRGYTRPVQQNAASLAGDAAGMIGPMLAVAKAQQFAKGLLQMGDNLAAPRTMNPQAGKVFVYPQAKALETAQLNAAKSIDEGGLGLLANNTPAQRAQAMGFTDDAYHGTDKEFGSFEKNSYFTQDPNLANIFADMKQSQRTEKYGANVYPVYINKSNVIAKDVQTGYDYPTSKQIREATNGGYDVLHVKNVNDYTGTHGQDVVLNPSAIRSRFAAFDPARRNEADLLGRADPELLKWMAGAGLLGTAGYSALQDR